MALVRYSKTVPQADKVLAKIGECRGVVMQASIGVRPFGPAYHALHVVIAAIDGLAAFISGERHYFSAKLGPGTGHVPPPRDDA